MIDIITEELRTVICVETEWQDEKRWRALGEGPRQA